MNKENNKDKISVIIRCKNEERWIGHSIQSILDLINKPEIIVVDNHSEDESLNIVKNFSHDPLLDNDENSNFTDIKILKIKDYTPGKALNLGINNASHEIILIISAHCILKKINLEKHIKDLKQNVCIFGNQTPVWNGKKIKKKYIWSHFVHKEITNMYSKFEERYFLHNAISIYKRNFIIENPFDEYLQGKEDRYWCEDMIKNKHNILYDPELEVDHHYTINGNTWKGLA